MPFSEPATVPNVKLFLGVRLTSEDEQELVQQACYAVNSWLHETKGPDHDYSDAETFGATMLAARVYRRQNSPDGVQTNGVEGTVYVMRNDPDVAMLLGLGVYKRPMVG